MPAQNVNKIILGTSTVVDLTQDNLTADKLCIGATAHDKSGALITGTHDPNPTLTITPPTKTSYEVGDQLDLTGIAVNGTLPTGYTKVLTNECVYTPADGDVLTVDDQTIDVVYPFLGRQIHATQNIYVAYVDHIYVSTPPTKTVYGSGDLLDLTGIVVKAVWGDGTEVDVTNQCVFNPAEGTIVTDGMTGVDISWTWSITGQTFTTRQAISIFTLYSWATGTDEQVAEMLQKHYAGEINLHDHWKVGDTRTINISAVAGDRWNGSQSAQSIQFVLTEKGGKTLSDGTTTCAFQVDSKNCLTSAGPMSGGTRWGSCKRRDWLNTNFVNAFPSSIKGIFKEFTCETAEQNGTMYTTDDYFAIRSEYEIFGTRHYSKANEGTPISWYKTEANRYKTLNGSGSIYWERSVYDSSNMCICTQAMQPTTYPASANVTGIAVFGCI